MRLELKPRLFRLGAIVGSGAADSSSSEGEGGHWWGWADAPLRS